MLTYKMTGFFLDRAAIVERVGKRRAGALGRIGAFVRRKARTRVLRRRKRSSAPGDPPSVHSRDSVQSLKNILFAYDPSSESLVVGPVRLNGRQRLVPQLLEQGGEAEVDELSADDGKTWQLNVFGRRPRRGEIARKRTVRYAPRPFMVPALEQTIPEIPTGLRNFLDGQI